MPQAFRSLPVWRDMTEVWALSGLSALLEKNLEFDVKAAFCPNLPNLFLLRPSSKGNWRSLGTWAWLWSCRTCRSQQGRPSCETRHFVGKLWIWNLTNQYFRWTHRKCVWSGDVVRRVLIPTDSTDVTAHCIANTELLISSLVDLTDFSPSNLFSFLESFGAAYLQHQVIF